MTQDFSTYFAPNYTDKKINADWNYLKRAKLNDLRGSVIESTTQFGFAITGNSCSDKFFCVDRSKTSSRKGSVYDWVEKHGIEKWKETTLADCKNNNRKNKIEDCTPRDYLSSAQLRSTTACQFKPRVASLLMNEFKPTRVLDFSAGWGDRCIGVMAKGIDYIGIDSNTELKPAYDAMSAKFEITPTMLYQPAETVDYTKLNYDMIFTSPPYFTLEIYKEMPEYNSYEHWVNTFLKPVIKASWTSLKEGGWMCLNVPSSMDGRNQSLPIYEDIVRFMGVPARTIKMRLQKRVQKTKKDGVIKSEKENKEHIFCWYKGIYVPEKIEEDDTESIVSETAVSETAVSETVVKEDLQKVLLAQYMKETDEVKLAQLERKMAFLKTLE